MELQRHRSELFLAVASHDIGLVRVLLEANSDPNEPSLRGESCLHVACSEAVGFQVAEFIVKNRLQNAEERVEIVKLLLEHNANPNAQDDMGFHPIHACILSSTAGSVKQLLQVLRILVAAGVDIDVLDGTSKGFNVFHFACAVLHSGEYSDEGDQQHVLEVVRLLVEELGANIIAPAKQRKMLPIHFAAERGHQEVISYLVEQAVERVPATLHAALNVIDINGNTPLHYAAMKKRETLMKWLISQGCDETLINNESETAASLFAARPSVLYSIEKDSPTESSFSYFSFVCFPS